MRSGWLPVAALAAACGGGGGGDPDAGAGYPDAGPGAELVFDESVVRTYELELAPADWQWLLDNATLEEYRPATLRFEGAEYPGIGLRFKGFYGNLALCFDGQGNLICDKLSMKLDFAEYDPAGRFYGLKKLNLHSMIRDPSKMHDALGYGLFRSAGIYTARTAYARVVVNGQLQGLFAVVENLDGRFTADRFRAIDGGDGNLYKEVWPVHDTEPPYLDALETNEDLAPSAAKMVRFAADLAAAGDADFESALGAWIDLDYWARYLAVDRLIENWDGVIAWYCAGGPCFNHNYYWYESATEDQVWPIPWDLDNAFEYPSPIRTVYGMPDWDLSPPPSCDPIPVFLGIAGLPPACDKLLGKTSELLGERYAAASREQLAGAFTEAALMARIDQLEAIIGPAVAEDPDLDPATWADAVNTLRNAVLGLRAYIGAKVN
jgi:CotH protein